MYVIYHSFVCSIQWGNSLITSWKQFISYFHDCIDQVNWGFKEVQSQLPRSGGVTLSSLSLIKGFHRSSCFHDGIRVRCFHAFKIKLHQAKKNQSGDIIKVPNNWWIGRFASLDNIFQWYKIGNLNWKSKRNNIGLKTKQCFYLYQHFPMLLVTQNDVWRFVYKTYHWIFMIQMVQCSGVHKIIPKCSFT